MIFSRSRPLDRKKVLLNDEDSEMVEKEWADFNKFQHLTRIVSEIIPENAETVLAEEYRDLRSVLEREPLIAEILWEVNRKKSDHCRESGMFHQFKYHVLYSSDILRYEGRDLESIRLLFQVIYMDMNGITNIGNSKGKIPFNQKSATKSLDLLGEIRELRIRIGMDMDQAQKEFVQSAKDISSILKPNKPPCKPDDIWVSISRIIE